MPANVTTETDSTSSISNPQKIWEQLLVAEKIGEKDRIEDFKWQIEELEQRSRQDRDLLTAAKVEREKLLGLKVLASARVDELEMQVGYLWIDVMDGGYLVIDRPGHML